MSMGERKRTAWANRLVRRSGGRFQRDRSEGLQDFYVWDELKGRLLGELGAVVESSLQCRDYPCRYEISVDEDSVDCRRVILASIKNDLGSNVPFICPVSGGAEQVSRLLFEHKNDGSLSVKLEVPRPIHPFMVDETTIVLFDESRARRLMSWRGLRKIRMVVSSFIKIDECFYPCRKTRFLDLTRLDDAFWKHGKSVRFWVSAKEKAIEKYKFSVALIIGLLVAAIGIFFSEAMKALMLQELNWMAMLSSFLVAMLCIFFLHKVLNRY